MPVTVHVQITPEDRAAIEAEAKRRGVRISDVVRSGIRSVISPESRAKAKRPASR